MAPSPRSIGRPFVGPVLLLILLVGVPTGRAEEDARPPAALTPFLGIEGLDVFDEDHRDIERMKRLAGLGPLLVRTKQIPWSRLEPYAPVMGGRHLHDWESLDAAVTTWQAAGYDPVPVLRVDAAWALSPREDCAWVGAAKAALSQKERDLFLGEAEGSPPPSEEGWKHWEQLVCDVAERYDNDETADAPGLQDALTWIQILGCPASSETWLGSASEYSRLLHHAGLGAARATARLAIVHGAVDFRRMGYDPLPDAKELHRRINAKAQADIWPPALLFEERRSVEFLLLTTSLGGVFGAVAHVGGRHFADEALDLRFLRRHLDGCASAKSEVWLVDTEVARLGVSSRGSEPTAEEMRIRAKWASAARRRVRSEERDLGRKWLEAGHAFDVVRAIGTARAAGADRVFVAGSGQGGGLDALVVPREGGGWRRTPAWYALRQANTKLEGQVSVEAMRVGRHAQAWRFALAPGAVTPWLLVVALDADVSWAGDPKQGGPIREVVIPVPEGTYVVEQTALADGRPERRQVEAEGGVLRLELTPAPVWVYPNV